MPVWVPNFLMCQGHVDMVTEKNSDVIHDFHKDALKLVRNGDWLKVRISIPAHLSEKRCCWLLHVFVFYVFMTSNYA